MRIDAYDFENTAKAVYAMNSSASERYDSWQDLMDYMETCAYMYCNDSNSFSTGGFQLTAYPSPDGRERCVRASVSAYIALKFLEGQG